MTTQSEVKSVSVQEAYEKSQSPDVRVIDIRMPFDYAGERIPGSLNLPNNAIRVRKAEVPEGKALLFLSEDGEQFDEAHTLLSGGTPRGCDSFGRRACNPAQSRALRKPG